MDTLWCQQDTINQLLVVCIAANKIDIGAVDNQQRRLIVIVKNDV